MGVTMRSSVLLHALALGTLGVVAALCSGCPPQLEVVFLQDDALEQAVRAKLGQPLGYLTRADLLRLTNLDARGLGIRSLQGLEHCENLTWLDLDANRISDITPLAGLINLTYLNLDSNEITDIGPLAGLRNLDGLSLFDNQIGDVQPLVTNATNGGLGFGDYVVLEEATLSERALTIDVPALRTLGVDVILAEEAEGNAAG